MQTYKYSVLTWIALAHCIETKQDDATVTVEEQYEQLTNRVRRDIENMHSGYYDEACSARILHVFDEMAFVVNLLRKYQKETTKLREENQRLREENSQLAARCGR